KLGDQIAIRLITTSSLSNNNQRTELEMVQAGTLGGSWESSILLTLVDPRWTVWSMPWLFSSYEEAEKVCASEVGRAMLDSLTDKGIVGLAYGFNGFRHLTNSKRPVTTLEDLNGLKIRVPSIQMFISLYRLWGADPSQMNFGDLFVALREGTMDGQENPLHVIESRALYELQKYLTVWEYSFDPLIFCISQRVWDTLSPAHQAAVREAAREAAAYQRRLVVENEKIHLENLKQYGMVVSRLTPDVQEVFRKSAEPVYREYGNVIGQDLLGRFLELTQ
ncbi:MAG TPA: DctP family TRAP transporter solute-binding subunit, partial [bacterium]|nr:DctP family TRAP transporter solute-binding subunit [bacterium]